MKISGFKALTVGAICLFICAFAAGCRRHNRQSPGTGATQSRTYTYIVRGIIEQLPAAGGASRNISIKTQAIENFIGPDDQPSPMPAMVMDYAAAKSVDLTRLRPSEKIEFTYRVNWQNGLNSISDIRELPAATVLNFQTNATRPATGSMHDMPKGN